MLQLNKNLGQVEQVEHPSAATGPSHVLHFAINFLRRQYVVIAVAVALTTLLGVVYLNTTPPTFTASARMLIDTRKQEVLFQQQLMGRDLIDTAMVDSQVEVLKSQTIAQAVVKDHHLTENPDFVGEGNSLWGTVTAAIFGAPPPEVRSETELTKRAVGAVMAGLLS